MELVPGLRLSHVRTTDERILGITRQTPGVVFELLQDGQQVRCPVTKKFHRVLQADVLA